MTACSDCGEEFPDSEFLRKNGCSGNGIPQIKRVTFCKDCGFDRRSSGRVLRSYGIPGVFKAWVSKPWTP